MSRVGQVIGIVVALIVIAIILPIGLGYVSNAGSTMITLANGTEVALSTLVNPAVLTLLTVLLPILAVIGITMWFIPKGD